MKQIVQRTHIGVYGIITSNDQLLLVQKNRGPYLDKLDLPGGAIKHGENITDALFRELFEEIGLKIPQNKFFLWENISASETFQEGGENVSFFHIGLVYMVLKIDRESINQTIKDEEVGGSCWTSLDADLEKLTPFAGYVLKRLKEQSSQIPPFFIDIGQCLNVQKKL
jgi:ADP-ribose pyrophosphatase YjhB (NUDIX family)